MLWQPCPSILLHYATPFVRYFLPFFLLSIRHFFLSFIFPLSTLPPPVSPPPSPVYIPCLFFLNFKLRLSHTKIKNPPSFFLPLKGSTTWQGNAVHNRSFSGLQGLEPTSANARTATLIISSLPFVYFSLRICCRFGVVSLYLYFQATTSRRSFQLLDYLI